MALALVLFVLAAAGCDCPTYKCVTPPAVTFDVRGSGDAGLPSASITGGDKDGTLNAISSNEGCYSSPCTHQYFEQDAEGARSFTISADGYAPAEVQVSLRRTESGCSVISQRVQVVLSPAAGSATSSASELGAGCGG